jgi:hypothetical protein
VVQVALLTVTGKLFNFNLKNVDKLENNIIGKLSQQLRGADIKLTGRSLPTPGIARFEPGTSGIRGRWTSHSTAMFDSRTCHIVGGGGVIS